MIDWLIALLSVPMQDAMASTAVAAPDLTAPTSVLGTIIANIAAAIPPTLAAIAALVMTLRNNRKQTETGEKVDAVATKADKAVVVAEATARQVEHTASRVASTASQAAYQTEQAVEQVVKLAEQRLSTADEDAQRAKEAVAEIVSNTVATRREILASLDVNRRLLQDILEEMRK